MNDMGWMTFGLGHWIYGVVIWGVIIAVMVMLFRGSGSKDD